MTVRKLTSAEAFSIASQWGSYMRDGDPGAVFYTFPAMNAVVKDEDHRKALIAYTDRCLLVLTERPDEDEEERDNLQSLRAYFETTRTEEQRETQRVWWSSSEGKIELSMTRSQAASVSQPGKDASEDVEALRKSDPILTAQLDAIKDEDLRHELKGYGAWDGKELANRDTNLMRLVWLAGGYINDQDESEDDIDNTAEV